MASLYRTLSLEALAGFPGAAHRVWPGHIALFEEHVQEEGHPLLAAPWRADHLFMVMVRRGGLKVRTEDGTLSVSAGEGLLIQPLTLRSFVRAGDTVSATVLAFTSAFMEALPWKPVHEGLWRLAMERMGTFVLPAADVARVAEPLQRLAQRIEHLGEHPRGRELVQNTFMELCLEFSAAGECPEHAANNISGRKEELVSRFVVLAQEQHVRRRRLSYYSDRLAVTSKHLSETVKDVTGRSAMQVLDDLLVSRSKLLLHERGRSISQVAYDLAFGDPAVFSKFFKRMTGRSPREFRAAVVG